MAGRGRSLSGPICRLLIQLAFPPCVHPARNVGYSSLRHLLLYTSDSLFRFPALHSAVHGTRGLRLSPESVRSSMKGRQSPVPFTPRTRSRAREYPPERRDGAVKGRPVRGVELCSPRGETSVGAVERESHGVCSLAGSLLYTLCPSRYLDRRHTAPVHLLFLLLLFSSLRLLATWLRRSYEGDRDTTGVTKGSTVVHTALVAEGEERPVVNTGVYIPWSVYEPTGRVSSYRCARGKLDPSPARKVINLTSYEARLMALTRMIHDHACTRVHEPCPASWNPP